MEKSTISVDSHTNSSLEYKPGFDLEPLHPSIGDIFRIFIPERFFLLSNSTIVDRLITGTTFYTPDSDMASIAVHCGCIFPHPKSSGLSRRWCTVTNFYEALCNEDKYAKIADILEIPTSVQVQGLLLDILIDNTLRSYQGSLRNGLKSKSYQGPTEYSMRVANYKIVTKFERIPRMASLNEYVRLHAKIPVFKFAFNREVGIEYSPDLFMSIFSAANIENYLFTTYKIFFDVDETRYEIHYDEDEDVFSLTELENPVEIREYRARKSKKPKERVIEEKINYFDIVALPKGLKIKGVKYEPVDTLFISMFIGKILSSNNK